MIKNNNFSCSDSRRNFKWYTNITAFKFFLTVPSSGGNRSEKENIFKSPEAPNT